MHSTDNLEKFKERVKKTGRIYLEGSYEKFPKEVLDVMDDEIWLSYMRSSENCRQKEKRSSRCQVRGKRGNLIRCSEENKCDKCPYMAKDPNGNPQPGKRTGSALSLDMFKEIGVEIPDSFNLEKQVEGKELAAAIYKALAALDEENYHIIILAGGAMPEREIAARVGLGQKTVNERKRKIRAHLWDVLKDYF